MRTKTLFKTLTAISALALSSMTMSAAHAGNDCSKLPGHKALTKALKASVKPTGGPANGGLGTHMWATVVNRAGVVCAVTFSGNNPGDQWPGSRVISAQKANTANAFSLPGMALSTANLWAATQPGGSLYGLQHSNPVNTKVAYTGKFENYGSKNDPLTNHKIGGINVFGGGLALYNKAGKLVGALGVSGNTSCADHNVAWRVRKKLALHHVAKGVNPANNDDGIIYDLDGPDNESASGFGHPVCGNGEVSVAVKIGAGSQK
jgi:uncharacterized protein GlcG (DUF336 family)